MNKFGRNYELTVQSTGGGPDTVIKMPFTIEFDVKRHRYSSATISVIRIYNLSETTRNKLRKNQINDGTLKLVKFRAGYRNDLSTLLVGNVSHGYSAREGTNYITTLEIFDGGIAYTNAVISKEYTEGTPYKETIVDLIKSLKDYGISLGSVGNIEGTTGRGLSLSGSTINNLRELSEGRFFIDNCVGHCLNKNECVPAPLKKINSASGLLGTPKLEFSFLNVEMLFEPKIIAGQKLEIDSITEKNFNGVFSVISIHHRGIISESVNGECTTSLTLEYGLGNLFDVQRAN